MIASTFWKKTIQGAILCDQSTRFDSSSCSRKLPAVWKNFFGTIGARSRTASSGHERPVARETWSRSKYSRIDGTSSSTTSSPSSRPTRGLNMSISPQSCEWGSYWSSNVTSLIRSALREPRDDLLGVPVRREDGVEDLDDAAVLGHEREPLVELLALGLEGRQTQRGAELAAGVRGDGERHRVPLCELDLVVERLHREACDPQPEVVELARAV